MSTDMIALRRMPHFDLNNVADVLRRRSPDKKLISGLKRGEEAAFVELVDRHHGSLIRIAQTYVRDHSIAEEVAQETWLIVLNGLDDFQGRSALKTWIFRILINRAKTRGARERRQIPISTLSDTDEPSVPSDRFFSPDHPQHALQWRPAPQPWPEERLLTRETVEVVREAVQTLPPAQQIVFGLRDVEGWAADEVCEALELTPENERVLLHRARARLRTQLENYFDAQ